MFAGYPVWWALGLADIACVLLAVPMAVHLIRMRRVVVPRGLGVWLLFLIWAGAGAAVLYVHAPGSADPASVVTPLLSYGYRIAWYVAATIVLLYVVNTRRTFSDRRVCLAMGTMFLVVTCGGLLGMVAPHFEFRSPFEAVLPHGLASNKFVNSLVHPVTAQLQDVLGNVEPRPSAPFTYTNGWGLAVGCFLPFFLVAWVRSDSRWVRMVSLAALPLCAVPVIYSLNRGLWLALIAAAAFVTLRYAAMGRFRMLVLMVGAVAMVAAVVVLSPLGHTVQERIAHPHSNAGRAHLGQLTVDGVLQGSPVMGFGGTREVQGNSSSIAGGSNVGCPACITPSFGTQGHLWLVLFSQGIGGLLLYLWFFLTQIVRHLRYRSTVVVASLAVLVVHVVTLPVYDTVGPSFVAVMVAVGLLWRARLEQPRSARPSPHPSSESLPGSVRVSSYLSWMRLPARSLVLITVLGGLSGLLFQMSREPAYTASEPVVVPHMGTQSAIDTVDTEASFLHADPVLVAVSAALDGRWARSEVADRLSVSATVNTRILHISFTAPDRATARRGAGAATEAFLAARARQQQTAIADPSSTAGDEAKVTGAVSVTRSYDGWIVSIASGLLLGLSCGLIFWWFVARHSRQLRRPRLAHDLTGLPVLAYLDDPDAAPAFVDVRERLRAMPPLSGVFAVPDSAPAAATARRLRTDDGHFCAQTPDVIVVATTASKVADVDRLRMSLARCDRTIVGLILVEA
jgi:capsular polysaccharide biosynthesis protein